MSDEEFRNALLAENENINILYARLAKTVFDIMNNGLAPEAMRERVLEWGEIHKRFGARSITATVGVRDMLVVACIKSETESNPLDDVPDANPQ